MPPSPASAASGWPAVARLYHAYVIGILLTAVTRQGADAAADLWFRLFRRQHEDMFLPGLKKLGIDRLPHAVACAQYHYLSNRVGGVKVEYIYESDAKAWVRFPPPRWIYDGTAIAAVPSAVSRAVLRGWYAQNGVSLGNPRLGFVCTSQTTDGQSGLAGYFLEHDRDLGPDERLRFSPGEEAPPFDPAAAPGYDPADWPEARLRKAHRNYAMTYVRTLLQEMPALFGPVDAAHLGRTAGRLIGLQYYDEIREMLGLACDGGDGDGATGFADVMAALARAQDDAAAVETDGAAVLVHQRGWRLMRGAAHVHPAAFEAWNGLWEGALAAHDRFLALEVLARPDYGDEGFTWRVRRRE